MGRDRIPDWLLERLAAGDLPDAEAASLRTRLEAEEGGRERLEAIAASNEAILAAHPPARVAASIRQRAAAGAAPRRRSVRLAPALVAPALAAAVVLAIQLPPSAEEEGSEEEVVRLKGAAPALAVFRESAEGAERLRDGAAARRGDRIQLGYQAAGRRFGAVVSVDGAGNVILHLPDGDRLAAPLEPGGLITLPSSYELDDAPRFERFFFVTADDRFEVEIVLEAARWIARRPDPARDDLPLPPTFEQTSFLLEKQP